MTDQKEENVKVKKPCLLRRILWWLWVILLVALLALGLFFAAPWKAIALIAIFLSAATILPRIYRKWFWLGVGIVIIALVVWVFLPDDNEGWRPYKFDKEKEQLQARSAVPDSENAAIVYNHIFANWKQKEANEPNLPYDKFDFARHNLWLSKDHPEIAAYLQYHKDTVEQLLQVSKFEQCAFPVIADSFILGEQMERISTMRRWAYLLISAGNNDTAEGNTNDAIEKYFAVFRMSHHLSRQSSVIEMLVSFASEALGLVGVNNFIVLGDANEPYLGKIEQTVSEIKHNWNSDLPGFIDTDKLMSKNMCGLIWYQVNNEGKTRLSRDPTAAIREQTRQSTDETLNDSELFTGFLWKKFMKAHTILNWFYVPSSPDKLGEIIDSGFEKYYKIANPDFNRSNQIQPKFCFKLNLRYLAESMIRLNYETYSQLHDFYLQSSARQRGTLLIIALRRYKIANGHWPDKLEDIKILAPAEIFIDPINGGSFAYKLTDDNFTLYSKGKNGIDEGGKREKVSFSSIGKENSKVLNKGCDDWMIWPLKNPENKKNSDDGKQ